MKLDFIRVRACVGMGLAGAWLCGAGVARAGTSTGAERAMALIPAGTFRMGDWSGEGWPDERPVHRVALSAFWMDRCETSNAELCELLQWALEQGHLLAGPDSVSNVQGEARELVDLDDWNCEIVHADGRFAPLPGRESFPAIEVTWYGALACANFRSLREGLIPCIDFADWSCDFSRDGYRLPTEAEWERAARGGLESQQFPWPSPLPESGPQLAGFHANYWGSGDPWETVEVLRTTPVGYYDGRQQPPGPAMRNGFGLHDMAGNVYEWCWDWYDEAWYATRAARRNNPTGPARGEQRVVRGGSWLSGNREEAAGKTTRSPGYYLRCANRSSNVPDNARHNRGFRCVRTAVANATESPPVARPR